MKQFPPKLTLPEEKKEPLLSSLHIYPTLAWALECLQPSRAPKCVIKGCSCTPKLKEYVQRCVHDVDHRTVLYYARYRCSDPHGKRTFSTIDDDYLASSPDILLAFPYLLTYQTALVYDSMLTTKGISGACSNINCCW
ncbi:hypothetical protein JG687_00007262 [Phytophthora cactorum]|uniref:Uncharacterized protein n=1 Tax=Phytophthora cactorum TaxID=29920 RepID=A0A8T1UG15_9STRA|nr:hypothetical protein JG687_00007262 [Phytophthora cactorum]